MNRILMDWDRSQKTIVFCLYILLLQSLHSIAQPLCRIREFTTRDGLAQRIVSDIIQDREGYMWFSTWNGLTRFDNYSLVSYRTSRDFAWPLTNSRINYIRESSTGNIWCGTNDNRVFLFDRETENYIDVLAPKEEEMKQKYTVRGIYPLEKGVTWIVCDRETAFRVDDREYMGKEGITAFNTYDRSLAGGTVFQIFQDRDGDEWVLTDKGITIIGTKSIPGNIPFVFAGTTGGTIVLSSRDGMIAHYSYERNELLFPDIGIPSVRVSTFSRYSPDVFMIGTSDGLYLYDALSGAVSYYDLGPEWKKPEPVLHARVDSGGFIWIFTESPGVFRLDPGSGRVQHFVTEERMVPETQPEHVYFVYEDPGGTVWVLPRNGTLGYYDPGAESLRELEIGSGEKQYAYAPAIRKQYADKQGNLWLATSSAVSEMSFLKEHVSSVDVDHGSEARAFLRDSADRLWIGTKSGRIQVLDPDGTPAGYLAPGGKLESRESTFARSGIYAFAEDAEHNIWIGTRGEGLFRLTPSARGGNFKADHWLADPSDPYSLSSNDIYTIRPDSRGNIWIGTFKGGLNLAERSASGGIRFIHPGNQLKGYPQNEFPDIRFIAESSDRTILIATTNGLVTFSADFEKVESIRFYTNRSDKKSPSGLYGNNVMHVYEGAGGECYVVTLDGGFQPIVGRNLLSDSLRFGRFDEAQPGIVPDRALSILEDEQALLWVVCEDGLTRFDPATGGFESFGRDYLMQDVHFTEAIPARNPQGLYLVGSETGMIAFAPQKMIKSAYVPPIVFTYIDVQGPDPLLRDEKNGIVLSRRQRNILIRFAALDYTNASGIRYAYRLAGSEGGWKYADDTRSVNYVNLPKGEYVFQVRSTNSDGVWTDNIRELPIRVLPKFGETHGARILYGFLLLLLILIVLFIVFYIYRLRYRVGMEQQLADVKLRFFTDIAHELRTPITLISSPVSEVLEHERLSPTAREYLGIVQNNTTRMLRLINEILDFRKIQNKKMKLLLEEIDLKTVAGSVMDDFSLIANEKNIDFRLTASAPSAVYWGDREKTEKILFNLLSNAFKYTPAGKSIEVRIEEEGDHVSVAVADTGIGISSDKLPSLFQRFVTFSSYNSIQPSSGIGLSLTWELTELHHAEIRVVSEEGKGSEFKVRFRRGREHFSDDEYVEFILNDSSHPAQTFLPVTPEEKSPEDPGLNGIFPLTILVVEDNAELLSFLTSVLSRSYRIVTASNGREGLEKVLSEGPDFILTDIMMPEMDGLEMVRAIKENPDACHIPIIVLSAKSSIEDRIHGLEYGIDDYMTKPFSSSYLKTRIESLIQQRRLLQQQFMSSISEEEGRKFSLDPAVPNIIPFDLSFMERLLEFMEKNMDNSLLAVNDMAGAMNVSRSLLYHKVKTITGCSPVDFIREIRIKRAIQLIGTGEFTFSQIANMTGFNDPKYFGKCFKRQTGMNPTEYKTARKGNTAG